ncbi:MAG: hypothetical protein LV479_12760 [Methylacidiphilales bacterium]|nr:hypothetical protein [Candidatus Methylacidiphilales bacterium]
MKGRLLCLGAALFLTATQFVRADNQETADGLFHQLLNAQVAGDYSAFVAHGTTELKAALTKTQFDASCELLAPRLNGGYDLAALGELNQKGYQIYLYRLRFKGGGDDLLATLTLKDGEVAGIYFK